MTKKKTKFLVLVLAFSLILGIPVTGFATTGSTTDGGNLNIKSIATDLEGKSMLDYGMYDKFETEEEVAQEKEILNEDFPLDGTIFVHTSRPLKTDGTNDERIALQEKNSDTGEYEAIDAIVTLLGAGNRKEKASITAKNGFSLNSEYRVMILPGLSANNGETTKTYVVRFKTVEQIPGATVTSTKPENEEINVTPTDYTKMEVIFKNDLDEASVTTDKVEVYKVLEEEEIAQGHTFTVNGSKLEIKLTDEYEINTTYKVVLKAGIMNSMGGEMAEDYSYSFTTAGLVKFMKPRLDNETIPQDQELYVHFHQEVKPDSIEGITVVKTGTSGNPNSLSQPIDCNVTFDDEANQDITITPISGSWDAAGLFEVRVPATIKTATGVENGRIAAMTFQTQSVLPGEANVRLYNINDADKTNILELKNTSRYNYESDVKDFGAENLRVVIPGNTYVFEMDIANASAAAKRLQAVFEMRTGFGVRPESGGTVKALTFDNTTIEANSGTTVRFEFELPNEQDSEVENSMALDLYLNEQGISLGKSNVSTGVPAYHLKDMVCIPYVRPNFQIGWGAKPAANEKDVSVDTGIEFTIEPRTNWQNGIDCDGVSKAALTNENIKLFSGGEEIPCSVTADGSSGNYQVTMTPNSALKKGRVYEVKLLPSLKDELGYGYEKGLSWKFATEYDVTFVNPSLDLGQAWQLAPNSEIGIGFKNGTSIEALENGNPVTLTKVGTAAVPYGQNINVPCDYSLDESGKFLTVIPKKKLDFAGHYRLSVGGNIDNQTEFYTYGIQMKNGRVVDSISGQTVNTLKKGGAYTFLADIENKGNQETAVKYELLLRGGNGARTESGGITLGYDLENRFLDINQTASIAFDFIVEETAGKTVYFDVLPGTFGNSMPSAFGSNFRKAGPTGEAYRYQISVK